MHQYHNNMKRLFTFLILCSSAGIVSGASYNANISAVGGIMTTNYADGGYYVTHTYTNTVTTNFVVSGVGSLDCEFLVVAGGASGAEGGGGAGGVLTNSSFLVSAGTTTVTVGGGGTDGNGTNSVFGTNIAYGGGKGSGVYLTDGNDGGSSGFIC